MLFGGGEWSSYPVLSAMLAPALFLTASAALLTNANNRLARISDRLRDALAEAGTPAALEAGWPDRLDILRRRAQAILQAIRLLQLAIGLFVLTSLAIAVDSMVELHLPLLPTILAVGGVVMLFAGTVAMWREATLAVRSLQLRMRELRPRGGEGPPSP